MAEEKEFVFKITSRLIERAIYIVIIILLLAVIIAQNIGWIGSGVNGNAATDATTSTTLATTSTLASATTLASAAASATSTTSTTTTAASTGILSADIAFVGDPAADSTTGKVTKVQFRITNKGDKFVPKVEFFWYDPAAGVEEKTLVRATWSTLAPLDVGQSITDALEQGDSYSTFVTSYVNKDEAGEVFIMKLYDRTTGKNMTTSDSKTIQSVKVVPQD